MTIRSPLWRALTVALCIVASAGPTFGFDQFQLYFNGGIADAGKLGGAAFEANGDFWLIGFGGEQRIRHLEFNGSTWSGTDNVISSELALFGRADDLAAGNANTDWGGQIGTSPGALLLNPAPLTIDVPTGAGGTQTVVYPAGSLAFIADNVGVPIDTGGTSRADLAKKLYRYDLRTVLEPTTMEPDYNTARGFDGGPVIGAFGRADWNDVFQHVVSEQDLRNQSGSTGSDGFGRQFGWSSDGQSIYAVDSSRGQGGIFRIDPTRSANDADGFVRLLDNSGSQPEGTTSIRSEPAILHTSSYDYAPGDPAVGDQIVVEGSGNTGNHGGVNVFVDTGGNTLGAPSVVFTEQQFRDFADYYAESTPRYIAIGAAPNGDLYLSEQQTDLLFRYDTQGRFVKIASEREHNLFQASVTGSFGNDDISNLSFRTSMAPGFEVTEVVYVDSSIDAPIGVLAHRVGDFDRDNDVDADDFAAFSGVLGTRNAIADDANVLYDLNGNETAFRDTNNDGDPVIKHTFGDELVIDWKDVKILQQFEAFPNGDANFDFALDFTDLDVMSANYYTTGQTAATWALGDFASVDPGYLFDVVDANFVNEVDLDVLADAWLNDLGQPAPSESELASRYSGQFLADAIAAFTAGEAIPGDYDRDGDVDDGDYFVWAAAYGEAGAGLDADGNGDGLIDAADYTIWRDNHVIDPLASDFNSDGVVDAADYTIWRDTLGETGSDLAADANGDGVIDQTDYDRWMSAYGVTATALAVPEPAAWLMALAGMLALAHRR
ncbi:hypothetical protein MalM25_15950 [Planctomycetes bacterium MalM25]|nr:hypothetical protein MalM25_15950 [Planctomycetes bacterium MalM25]